MGISIRVFIIEEDDTVHKLSHAAFERLIRQDPKECLPQYAGQKVRYALIAVEMKNRKPVDILHTDEPNDVDLDAARAIKDFLPPPDQLVFKEKTVKITLALSEGSVNFFKAQADKHGLKYQQMIRSLIDKYVSAHTHST